MATNQKHPGAVANRYLTELQRRHGDNLSDAPGINDEQLAQAAAAHALMALAEQVSQLKTAIMQANSRIG